MAEGVWRSKRGQERSQNTRIRGTESQTQIISARVAPVAVSWSTLQGNPSLLDLADLNERKQWPDKKGRCKARKPQAGVSPYFLWSSR
ncbi:MAG: hypothetical protein DMG98_01195 [Acidobacteria bacterium]|nr:MAG: hypothetical protein DMG98_01195 [Acidobacteriota bacterium]